MQSATEFVETHRPAGGRRSGKRDLIVDVFLRQKGHLGADELVNLIRRQDKRISRATIYRTLQWMVEAGIARRVDFGEGRFRFEHSYRHPRHFHLICKTCGQSFEFLSSDIEMLIEEVARERQFDARQSVLQIYGICATCRGGQANVAASEPTEAVFARDALRIAIATERSGLEFYTRAAKRTRDARGRRVFSRLAEVDFTRDAGVDHPLQRAVDRGPADAARPAANAIEEIVGADVPLLAQEYLHDFVALGAALAATGT